MKKRIYNRRNFWEGLGLLALGLALPLTCLWKGWERFDVRDAVLTLALVFLGGGLLLRSLNAELSRKDRLEERDERRCMVALKTRSAAFRAVQAACFLLLAGAMIGYAVSKEPLLAGMAVGCGLLWPVMFTAELVATLYFESKC